MPNNMPSQPEFPIVRRGFDPDSVDRYMAALQRELADRVAAAEARYSNLEMALAEAHKREEAVHLTLVAATKTKEEMLVNARRETEQTISDSRERADELLGEAKKEAFRLMTDARQTAQETTTVARASAEDVRAKAQAVAESIRDKARLEAIEMINSVETDTTSLLAAREVALKEMRAGYDHEEGDLRERISVLSAAANDLESRLKAIASGTLGAASHLVSDMTNSQPAPQTPRQTVAPKPRPPIREDLRQKYVAAARPEKVMEDAVPSPIEATTTTAVTAAAEVTASVTTSPPAVEISAEEIAAEEIAAAGLAAAEAQLHTAAFASPEQDSARVNGHYYVEPDEDVTEEDSDAAMNAAAEPGADPSADDPTRVDQDEPAAEPVAADEPAAEEPEVIVEPEAQEEQETEEEPERVPASVGATPRPAPFEDADGRKGSYYSRRSAKLPRIGNEAGRNALAAANAIRGASRGMPGNND